MTKVLSAGLGPSQTLCILICYAIHHREKYKTDVSSVAEHCFQLKINKNLFLPAGDIWISLFFHGRNEAERSCSSSEKSWVFTGVGRSPLWNVDGQGWWWFTPLRLPWHPANSPAAMQEHIDLSTACWAMNHSRLAELKGIINMPKQSFAKRGKKKNYKLWINENQANILKIVNPLLLRRYLLWG